MKNNGLISEIRSVLINDWDPIGIGNNPNLYDEYDSYIGSIIEVLMKQLTVESIVSFLKRIEYTEMEIENVDSEYLYDVATKLKSIGEKYCKK